MTRRRVYPSGSVSCHPARAEAVLTEVLAPMLKRPVEQLRTVLPIGSAEECAARLRAFERAGAQRVFLWPLAEERSQLQVFRERVAPLLEGEQP
jgi:alkanesulfonate monooxygenase SsuD/methylene tetrahydromethanopterin reductase-like flavin-dependent oxidoreductase (luciferase family)